MAQPRTLHSKSYLCSWSFPQIIPKNHSNSYFVYSFVIVYHVLQYFIVLYKNNYVKCSHRKWVLLFSYKQVSWRNGDEWFKMTNAFILCDFFYEKFRKIMQRIEAGRFNFGVLIRTLWPPSHKYVTRYVHMWKLGCQKKCD